MHTPRAQGFTLLEILLVISIISILASIVVFAINPGRQLAQARNAQRQSDVNTIINAVYQYIIDNNALPDTIPLRDNALTCASADVNTEICPTVPGAGCQVALTVLVADQRYLVSIPADPEGPFFISNASAVGYLVWKNSNDRVTVCAPHAELGETVSVTR